MSRKVVRLDAPSFRRLLAEMGPSLGLWRAAEVAALRRQRFEPPVLEFGCGDGLVTSFVLDRVDIGLDPDEKAVERASRRGLYRRLELLRLEQSALASGSVATILGNSVLEHVPRPRAVLAAARRLLQPGGRLIFTVPTEAFSRCLALPLPRYAAWRNRGYGHFNLWPAVRWFYELERAGFEVETTVPYLRGSLVRLWDVVDVLQRVKAARRLWRRLGARTLDRMAERASRLDLSSPEPGGGRLVVARSR